MENVFSDFSDLCLIAVKNILAKKIEVFRDLYSDCSCVYLFFSTCFSLKSKYLKIMCACVLTNQRIAGNLLISF